MWCQVQPPNPPQPMTSHPCPRSTPWPRTQTAAASTHWRDRWMRVSEHSPWPHLSACLPASVPTFHLQYPTINQPSPSLLLFTPFSPIWKFCPQHFLLPPLTSMNRSIFLFSFPVWFGRSCWSSSSSNLVLFGLLAGGQSYLCYLLGQMFLFLFLDIV